MWSDERFLRTSEDGALNSREQALRTDYCATELSGGISCGGRQDPALDKRIRAAGATIGQWPQRQIGTSTTCAGFHSDKWIKINLLGVA
jgi:hypothetical protein